MSALGERYTITPRSSNTKTGPIGVTTSPATTCPAVCALRRNGCYADSGPIRRIWDRLTSTPAGETFANGPTGKIVVHGRDALLTFIRRQHKALWRHNQAGDLYANARGWIDAISLRAITAANKEAQARPLCYTHHNVLGNSMMAEHNRLEIAQANADGFTVNLSANNLHHADKLHALGIAPVASLAPHGTKTGDLSPAGVRLVVCPAQESEHVSCYNCGQCAIASRDYFIVFLAHGNGAKKAEALASR